MEGLQYWFVLSASVLCFQGTDAVTFLYGSSERYNAECPDDEAFPEVPVPESDCDVQRFIMCNHGKAEAIGVCPWVQRFSPVLRICVPWQDVDFPASCGDATTPPMPTTCVAFGPEKVPIEETCKNYIWCQPDGTMVEMPCVRDSYFIPELQECRFNLYPYSDDIPLDSRDTLEACVTKDPWPTTTLPPTTTPST